MDGFGCFDFFKPTEIRVETTSQKIVCNLETEELFYGETSGQFSILIQEMLHEALRQARIKKTFDNF